MRARSIPALALAVLCASCAGRGAAPPPEIMEVRAPEDAPPPHAARPDPDLVDLPLPDRLRVSVIYRLEQDPGGAALWLRLDASAGPAADLQRAVSELSADMAAGDLSAVSGKASGMGGRPAELFDLTLPGGGFGLFLQARPAAGRLIEIGGSGVGDADKAGVLAVLGSARETSGPLAPPPGRARWHRVAGVTFAAPIDLRLTQARFAGRGDQLVATVSPSCAQQASAFLGGASEAAAVGEPREDEQMVGGALTRLIWATTRGPDGERLLRLASSRTGIDCLLVAYQASLGQGAQVLSDDDWLAMTAAIRGAVETQ